MKTPRGGILTGMKRLLAIGVIWLGCAIAWAVLGSTIVYRSGEADGSTTGQVYALWGGPNVQAPPSGALTETHVERVETDSIVDGHTHVLVENKPVTTTVDVEPDSSKIRASLGLEQRRKGLMWFPTYAVAFDARYAFTNPSSLTRRALITFPLPTMAGVIDGLTVLDDATGAAVDAKIENGEATWSETFTPGASHAWRVHYATRGTSSWTYEPSPRGEKVRDFSLALTTDFAAVDFPAGAISPTHGAAGATGWSGDWTFTSLVSQNTISVTLPSRVNPGPLASRITFFAPIGLLFFFFVIAILGAAQGKAMHPLNYLFLSCAFFAFHLLFAYLVDHLEIAPSLAIASTVSVALVVSYARLFVGWRFALREMAISQLLYLVLFSWTFFWQGFTGLAITIGAILTLFVMMQFTGRVKWGLTDLKGQVSTAS